MQIDINQRFQWISEKGVAKITGLSLSTLQKHRFRGHGIPYSKIGRAVRYALSDVEAFMENQKITPSGNGILPKA